MSEFRNVIRFRPDVWNIAHELLKIMKAQLGCSDGHKNCTIVTVHLRMGDYAKHIKNKRLGPNILNETDYIPKALQHVLEKYQVGVIILKK